jgi:pyrroline-5-carboxylate reductase
MKTLFFGAGSMASFIISGALASNFLKKEEITVTNRSNQQKLHELTNKLGVSSSYDTKALLQDCDVIILAVKPKDCLNVLSKIKGFISPQCFIISVLAGISLATIEEALNWKGSLARAMPNTSASVGKSATAISFNNAATDQEREWTLGLFNSIGITSITEENQLDLITALSGSGPAYIYYVAEILESAAVDIGLNKKLAKEFIIQTIVGAGEMLKHTGLEAEELRKDVTSQGGTTEAGIKALQQHEVEQAFYDCIESAKNRSEELREEIGGIMQKQSY